MNRSITLWIGAGIIILMLIGIFFVQNDVFSPKVDEMTAVAKNQKIKSVLLSPKTGARPATQQTIQLFLDPAELKVGIAQTEAQTEHLRSEKARMETKKQEEQKGK